jgi:cellulose synthase/poly-beta-1,6-N-acetylglucosamine synthase-like glycosyltransferase
MILLYLYLAIGTLYIAVFAVASAIGRKKEYPSSEAQYRFRVLFPAYKEDAVICESVKAALDQQYPSTLFDICVLADHMSDDTLNRLRTMHAEVLSIQVKESSKARALTLAMQADAEQGKGEKYDYAVILDADNVVPSDYLQQVNDYLCATAHRVLQTHRTAKNRNTPTAMLDAAIEEMNNSIFRAGHVRLGISSSLIGSGMVIDYHWFATHIPQACTAGEDKELEEMMLREKIHIGYAPHILVYDEKVQRMDAMQQQRRRWIATQIGLASLLWSRCPQAMAARNGDYLLKAIETSIPPRSLLLALITAIALLTSLLLPHWALAWWLQWGILITSMYIAIPQEFRGSALGVAIQRVPSFLLMMAGNLFHLKGASKKFIHTRHGEKE